MKRTLCLAMVGMGIVLSATAAQAQIFNIPVPTTTTTKRNSLFRYYDPRTKRFITYQYGKRSHMDRIAYDLTRNSNALCWTAHRYYQANPSFRYSYKQMYRLVTDAEHIQKLIKDGYYRTHHTTDHIVNDLIDMDRLVSHVRNDVRYWHRDDSILERSFRGRAVTYDDSVLVRLAKLEDTLHHLMRDYGVDFNRSGRVPSTAGSNPLVAPRPN